MRAFHQLPSELFYEISLYLPLTKDVLAFTLTNSRIREALSTPALFKARLALRGWDVSAWKDEDDTAQSLGDLKRWMCIDHTYSRVTQLFEEAAADGHFLIATDSRTDQPVLWGRAQPISDSGQDNRCSNSRQISRRKNKGIRKSKKVHVFDGDRTTKWLENLSKVLPLFVTHHRGGNISQITDAKYRDILRASARVIGDLCTVVRTVDSSDDPEPPPSKVTSSDYSWFERICFSLLALLIQCDADTIVSIFNTNTSSSTTKAFGCAADQSPSILPDAPLTLESISERYFSAFIFQTVFYVTLHLDAVCLDALRRPTLLAPRLPHFDPRSSPSYSYYSYFGDGVPVEPGIPTITVGVPARAASLSPLTSTPSPPTRFSTMRPWLRNGLAGTPLANLSLTNGSAWAGYYTQFGLKTRQSRQSPMYLELRIAQPPPDSESDSDPDHTSYFHGEGHDSGPFTISGWCDARTGVVGAIKAYKISQWEWEWHGVLTPFGMVGTWGLGSGGGWWWIWPREWSPTTTRHD